MKGLMKSALVAAVLCLFGCRLQAQVIFNLSSTLGVGSDPNSIAVADVNGDGKADLICANYYGNSLSVLTNNGSGGFGHSNATYAVGSGRVCVTAADVNGDGKVDLISANQSADNTLTVLTNNGSGSFVFALLAGRGQRPGIGRGGGMSTGTARWTHQRELRMITRFRC